MPRSLCRNTSAGASRWAVCRRRDVDAGKEVFLAIHLNFVYYFRVFVIGSRGKDDFRVVSLPGLEIFRQRYCQRARPRFDVKRVALLPIPKPRARSTGCQ